MDDQCNDKPASAYSSRSCIRQSWADGVVSEVCARAATTGTPGWLARIACQGEDCSRRTAGGAGIRSTTALASAATSRATATGPSV